MSEIVTYFLEMNTPQILQKKPKPDNFEIFEAEIKQFKFNRLMYQFVGESWNWNDKDSFSDEEWK